MKFNGSLGAATLVAVVTPAVAQAGGAVIDAAALSPAQQALFTGRIAQARALHPEAFEAVRGLADAVPGLDARKRGRFAPISRLLKSLGPDATWPLVEAIAFDGVRGDGWTPSAQIAWQSALLEALGELADAEVAPVLDAVLDARLAHTEVYRAAVVARAWLGDVEGTARLVAMSRQEGPLRTAILSGLGYTRRLEAAQALADALATSQDVERQLAVGEALSDAGNAWVWPLITDARRADEAPIRAVASRALVAAYLRTEGAVQRRMANMLLVVANDETRALVEGAALDPRRGAELGCAGACSTQRDALQRLSARLAANPLNRR